MCVEGNLLEIPVSLFKKKEYFLNNLARFASMLSGIRPILCRPDSAPRRGAHQQATGPLSPRVHHILSNKSPGSLG